MSYVPPHLRGDDGTRKPEKPPDDSDLSIRDIQHYYWGGEDIEDGSVLPPQHSTLNDSSKSQGTVTHVFLFNGANPRWKSDHIIFVKSNLEILPRYDELKRTSILSGNETEVGNDMEEASGMIPAAGIDKSAANITPLNAKPVACFEQKPKTQHTHGFNFAGYYNIEHVALLAPHSKGLARMLEQKWSQQDKSGNAYFPKRRQEQWADSLRHEWAVIKFQPVETKNQPSPPNINKLPDNDMPRRKNVQGPQKSVNQLLAEMRLGKETREV